MNDAFFSRWKDILERTLADIDREIASLSESKDALENSLEAKNLPTEVNVENLVTREGRQDIDVVGDEVEDQLRKVRMLSCLMLKKSVFIVDSVFRISYATSNVISVYSLSMLSPNC